MATLDDLLNAGNKSANPAMATKPVRPVTDLSPHVTGGSRKAAPSPSMTTTVHDAALIVVSALVILWLSGALVLRTHNI